MIAEYNEFQTAFKTKDDKYRKLLGLDEEELQSEALLLESSLKKEVKQSAERSAIPRVFYKLIKGIHWRKESKKGHSESAEDL